MLDSVQWGTVGEWVGGIGTAGALAVSIWLAWRAHLDATQARQQARRAQASRVFLTVSRDSWGGHRWPDKGVQTMGGNYNLTVENRSDLPILDVLVIVSIEPLEVLTPGGRDPSGTYEVGAVLPGVRETAVVGVDATVPLQGAEGFRLSGFATFTDAAGVRWRRGDDHRLNELPSRTP